MKVNELLEAKYNGWMGPNLNLYYVCGTFKKEKVVWDGPYKNADGAKSALSSAEREFPHAKFTVLQGKEAVKTKHVPFEPGMLGEI
jgi:hypothetical protein